ncbi:PREDICTED: uncharacterized protein LOC106805794 [Priapulus caudatus]|uniref:Uncharacterized protein LOC106805794 n=1 Tax=Priapulus caudatus TaxID=37621 RepID=A0ABM1DSU4_PRICU|nr:PREDICTED: uncharacterized protein LOC106805794 [Priapulus caudatus]XP_014663013.1 PREDICTED: uncharacterized protein LOC106805794 [Priapulus caudatus]XP_014663014.1 PREDICTED: uncharacterized protein LOC106805794 [Priapulus caudatus]XP_014663015.1 PREDICTED: uncharacterized protein LOC106805794 [Priapulus caudatus]
MAKWKGPAIPRRKDSSNALFRDCLSGDREYREMIMRAENSYYAPPDPAVHYWLPVAVHTVNNKYLWQRFYEKKHELQSRNHDSREQCGFGVSKNGIIQQICMHGLKAVQRKKNHLGDSSKGLNVHLHADEVMRLAQRINFTSPLFLVVYKVMLGRQCLVPPDYESSPSPDFDSHIASSKAPPNMPKNHLCGRAAQGYLYEFGSDGKPVSCPRHCVPAGIITYVKVQDHVAWKEGRLLGLQPPRGPMPSLPAGGASSPAALSTQQKYKIHSAEPNQDSSPASVVSTLNRKESSLKSSQKTSVNRSPGPLSATSSAEKVRVDPRIHHNDSTAVPQASSHTRDQEKTCATDVISHNNDSVLPQPSPHEQVPSISHMESEDVSSPVQSDRSPPGDIEQIRCPSEDDFVMQSGKKRKAIGLVGRGGKRKSLQRNAVGRKQKGSASSNIAESVKLKRRCRSSNDADWEANKGKEAEEEAAETAPVPSNSTETAGTQKRFQRKFKSGNQTNPAKKPAPASLLKKKTVKGRWASGGSQKNSRGAAQEKEALACDPAAAAPASHTGQHDAQERLIISKINLLRRDPDAAIQQEIVQMRAQLERIRMRRRGNCEASGGDGAADPAGSAALIYMDVCGGATWSPSTDGDGDGGSGGAPEVASLVWGAESGASSLPVISNVMSVDSQLLGSASVAGSSGELASFPAVYIKQEPVDYGYLSSYAAPTYPPYDGDDPAFQHVQVAVASDPLYQPVLSLQRLPPDQLAKFAKVESAGETTAANSLVPRRGSDHATLCDGVDDLPDIPSLPDGSEEKLAGTAGSRTDENDMKPPLSRHAAARTPLTPSPDLPTACSPSLTMGASFGRSPAVSWSYQPPARFMDGVAANLAQFLQGCMVQASTAEEIQQLAQLAKVVHAQLTGVPAVPLPTKPTDALALSASSQSSSVARREQGVQARASMVSRGQCTDDEPKISLPAKPVRVPHTVKCREQVTQTEDSQPLELLHVVRSCIHCKINRSQMSKEVQTSVQLVKSVGHQTVLELACLRCAAEPKTCNRTVQTMSSYLRSRSSSHRKERRSSSDKHKASSERSSQNQQSSLTGLLASHIHSSAHLFSAGAKLKVSSESVEDREEFAVPASKTKHRHGSRDRKRSHSGSHVRPAFESATSPPRLPTAEHKTDGGHFAEIPSPNFEMFRGAKRVDKEFGFAVPNFKPGLLVSSHAVQSPSDHDSENEAAPAGAKTHKPLKIPLESSTVKCDDPRLRNASGRSPASLEAGSPVPMKALMDVSPKQHGVAGNADGDIASNSSERASGAAGVLAPGLGSSFPMPSSISTPSTTSPTMESAMNNPIQSKVTADLVETMLAPVSSPSPGPTDSHSARRRKTKWDSNVSQGVSPSDNSSPSPMTLQQGNESNHTNSPVTTADTSELNKSIPILTIQQIRKIKAKKLAKSLANKIKLEASNKKVSPDSGESKSTESETKDSSKSEPGQEPRTQAVMKTQLLTCLDKLEQVLKASKPVPDSSTASISADKQTIEACDSSVKSFATGSSDRGVLYSPGFSPILDGQSPQSSQVKKRHVLTSAPRVTLKASVSVTSKNLRSAEAQHPVLNASPSSVSTPFGAIGTNCSFVPGSPSKRLDTQKTHRSAGNMQHHVNTEVMSPMQPNYDVSDAGITSPASVHSRSMSSYSPLISTPSQMGGMCRQDSLSDKSPLLSSPCIVTPPAQSPVDESVRHSAAGSQQRVSKSESEWHRRRSSLAGKSPLLPNPDIPSDTPHMSALNDDKQVYGFDEAASYAQETTDRNGLTGFRNPSPPLKNKSSLLSEFDFTPPPPPAASPPPLPHEGVESPPPPPPPAHPAETKHRRHLLPSPALPSTSDRTPLLTQPPGDTRRSAYADLRGDAYHSYDATQDEGQLDECTSAQDPYAADYSAQAYPQSGEYADEQEYGIEPGEYVEGQEYEECVDGQEYVEGQEYVAQEYLEGQEYEGQEYIESGEIMESGEYVEGQRYGTENGADDYDSDPLEDYSGGRRQHAEYGYRGNRRPDRNSERGEQEEDVVQHHPPAFCGSDSVSWPAHSRWPT